MVVFLEFNNEFSAAASCALIPYSATKKSKLIMLDISVYYNRTFIVRCRRRPDLNHFKLITETTLHLPTSKSDTIKKYNWYLSQN